MTKKYILKPGLHQFAPGSPAIHHDGNLSDQEAEWYLERFPHITQLFVEKPGDCRTEIPGICTPESTEDYISQYSEEE